MTKKNKLLNWKKIKTIAPYFLAALATMLVVIIGSIDKRDKDVSLSLTAFSAEKYRISVDQLSELYVVADLSDVLSLASASDTASNYVATVSLYNAGLSSTSKLEKPSVANINIPRGVVEYVVSDGESMDTIAKKFGVSTDQIRWSNGKKTTDIAAGDVLYVPTTPGIVYTVKSGDTVESIVEKYGSTAAEIIALNDLEVSGISEGMRILLKNGSLPEKERPEYVAPVVRTYTYTYLGSSTSRVNLVCNAGLGAGQCTTWGWLKRPDLKFIQANANRWDDIARAHGVLVDHTPAAGAIFQSDAGWYGHVGYVESVNADGSINVSERNYRGCYGVLFSTIPANEVGGLNFIH